MHTPVINVPIGREGGFASYSMNLRRDGDIKVLGSPLDEGLPVLEPPTLCRAVVFVSSQLVVKQHLELPHVGVGQVGIVVML